MLHSQETIMVNVVRVWPDFNVMEKILNFGHPQEELIFW